VGQYVAAAPGNWLALGAGLGTINCLLINRAGQLVAGSDLNGVQAWNGSAWSVLGSGLPVDAVAAALAQGPDGTIYAATSSPAADLTAVGYQLVGSVWQRLNLSVATDVLGLSVAVTPAGTLYIGWTNAGVPSAPTATAVNNTGTAATGPVVTFQGPGTLRELENPTTGADIFFDLPVQAGETVVLDLSNPAGITFVSNFRGNIIAAIQPGSQEASFELAPGANTLAVLWDSTLIATSGDTAAWLTWRNTHHAIDGSIPARLLP